MSTAIKFIREKYQPKGSRPQGSDQVIRLCDYAETLEKLVRRLQGYASTKEHYKVQKELTDAQIRLNQ